MAHITNNITPIDEYEKIYKDIHTQAVQEAISAQPQNPIIQTQPPFVDPVEKKNFTEATVKLYSNFFQGFAKS